MRCKVCGHDELFETEYRTGKLTAPALECAKCHALDLDERVAKSDEDRDSVRRAVAARQSAGVAYDSGTQWSGPASISVAQVDSVVSEVDVVLAEIRMCLEFCGQMTDGEMGKAVGDAQDGVRRIEGLIADLRRRCERATKRGAADDGSGTAAG
jgi:hypothetical protein